MRSVKELLELSPMEVDQMTERELRSVVSRMASAANKRLKRLEGADLGDMSFAYQFAAGRSYIGREGGKFGVEGKKRAQLLSEYKAIKHFMGMKTSSVRGWKEVRRDFERRTGEFSSESAERQFWKTYRRFTEIKPEALSGAGDSYRVQKMLYDMSFSKPGATGRAVEDVNLQRARQMIPSLPDETEEDREKRAKSFAKSLGKSQLLLDTGQIIDINTRASADRALILAELETLDYERRQQSDDIGGGSFSLTD